MEGQLDISEAAVHELKVHTDTIDVHVVEEYEFGAKVCSVFAEAALVAEGLMAKADAAMSAESGLVEIIDFDYNPHYALVAVKSAQLVQVEFDATVTQVTVEGDSVDDVNFVSATRLN